MRLLLLDVNNCSCGDWLQYTSERMSLYSHSVSIPQQEFASTFAPSTPSSDFQCCNTTYRHTWSQGLLVQHCDVRYAVQGLTVGFLGILNFYTSRSKYKKPETWPCPICGSSHNFFSLAALARRGRALSLLSRRDFLPPTHHLRRFGLLTAAIAAALAAAIVALAGARPARLPAPAITLAVAAA